MLQHLNSRYMGRQLPITRLVPVKHKKNVLSWFCARSYSWAISESNVVSKSVPVTHKKVFLPDFPRGYISNTREEYHIQPIQPYISIAYVRKYFYVVICWKLPITDLSTCNTQKRTFRHDFLHGHMSHIREQCHIPIQPNISIAYTRKYFHVVACWNLAISDSSARCPIQPNISIA